MILDVSTAVEHLLVGFLDISGEVVQMSKVEASIPC